MINLYRVETYITPKNLRSHQELNKKVIHYKTKSQLIKSICKKLKFKEHVTEYGRGCIDSVSEFKRRLDKQFNLHVDASFCILQSHDKEHHELFIIKRLYLMEELDELPKYKNETLYSFNVFKKAVLEISFSNSGLVSVRLKSKDRNVSWHDRSNGKDHEKVIERLKKEARAELKGKGK